MVVVSSALFVLPLLISICFPIQWPFTQGDATKVGLAALPFVSLKTSLW